MHKRSKDNTRSPDQSHVYSDDRVGNEMSRRPQEQELANQTTAIFPETREGNVSSSNASAPGWMCSQDDHRGKNSTDQVPRLEL